MNNLRALRLKSGLTKSEIAARAGIKVSQYIKLEDGERPLRAEYIKSLAAAHNVGFNQIIEPGTATLCIGAIEGTGEVRLFISNSQLLQAMAGSRIDAGKLDEVPTPPGATGTTVALVIRTNTMGQFAAPGALYYFDAEAHHTAEEMIGKVVLVHPEPVNGQDPVPRVRRIFRGTEFGCYDCVGPDSVVERNIRIRSVNRITWTHHVDE